MRLISLPHRLLKQPFSKAPFKVILICLKQCDPLRHIPTSQAAHAASRLCKRKAGGIEKLSGLGKPGRPQIKPTPDLVNWEPKNDPKAQPLDQRNAASTESIADIN